MFPTSASLQDVEVADASSQRSNKDSIITQNLLKAKVEGSKSAIGFYPGPDMGNTRYKADKAPSHIGLLMGGSASRLPKI